jgi:hypothetical protein
MAAARLDLNLFRSNEPGFGMEISGSGLLFVSSGKRADADSSLWISHDLSFA